MYGEKVEVNVPRLFNLKLDINVSFLKDIFHTISNHVKHVKLEGYHLFQNGFGLWCPIIPYTLNKKRSSD